MNGLIKASVRVKIWSIDETSLEEDPVRILQRECF